MASRSPVSSGSRQEEEEEGHDSYHGSKELDSYCVLPRDAILSFARDLILNHRMDEARKLLPNFLADKQNPQIFMFKFTLLLFDCFQDSDFRSHYNKFLLPFFTKCIAFDIDRRDLYLELVSLMVRHGHFWEAKEFLADQSRRVSWRTHRSDIVSMEALYKCYSSYFEFWSWHRRKDVADMKVKAIMICSAVEKHLLNEDVTCLDFMALCVGDMFTFYHDTDPAVRFFSLYADRHKNNLSAQLLLFHFLQLQLSHFLQLRRIDHDSLPLNHSLRLKCFQKISSLDPANPLIPSISSFIPETQEELLLSLSDSVTSLMSYLDYATNKNDLNSWNVLVQHLKNLLKFNRSDFDEVKEHYIENYHDHWQYYHFRFTNLGREVEKNLGKNLEKNLEREVERPKVLFCSMMDVCDEFVEQVFQFLRQTDVGLELKEETEEVIKLRGS